MIVWFTGLPASGKSTLAHAIHDQLARLRHPVCVLDGDRLRMGLNRDLGFSKADREENVRRTAEVAKLFHQSGGIVLVAVIAPYRSGRERCRALVPAGEFFEIWCRCPLAVCERRDPKGHYKKARAGELKEFTGVSAPYEEPVTPELIVDTDRMSIEDGTVAVMEYLAKRQIIVPTVESPCS